MGGGELARGVHDGAENAFPESGSMDVDETSTNPQLTSQNPGRGRTRGLLSLSAQRDGGTDIASFVFDSVRIRMNG